MAAALLDPSREETDGEDNSERKPVRRLALGGAAARCHFAGMHQHKSMLFQQTEMKQAALGTPSGAQIATRHISGGGKTQKSLSLTAEHRQHRTQILHLPLLGCFPLPLFGSFR